MAPVFGYTMLARAHCEILKSYKKKNNIILQHPFALCRSDFMFEAANKSGRSGT
jgi:hypothetical protein